MATMHERSIVVFGGTGFLGRRVVWHLRKAGFFVRIASRHPDRGHRLFGFDDPQLRSVEANIHDEQSIANALAGLIAESSQDPTLARNQNAISGFHDRSIVQRFRPERKNREFLVIATRLPVSFITDGSIRRP
jgi:saccharopine dehydrogenase-like NADP-dependent oxidoreductase